MKYSQLFVYLIRLVLYGFMIFQVYFEAGFYTAFAIFLITVSIEAESFLDLKRIKTMSSVLKILEKNTMSLTNLYKILGIKK